MYTFTLTDTTKSIELSKAEVEVVAVNASGNGTLIKVGTQYTSSIDFYAIAGETWASALSNASLTGASLQTYSNAIESGAGAQVKNSNGKYALEGYYAGTTKVLEITSTDQVTAVAGAKVESGKGSIVAQYASSKFTTKLAYNEGSTNTLTATATPAVGDDYDSYKITVASPAGAVLGTETTTTKGSAKTITVKFGTIEPAPGVYTATLYGVKGTGADATETKIDESAATLVKIAFAGGEATATSTAVPAAGVTDIAEIDKTTLEGYAGSTYFTKPAGKVFDAWTVDGTPITYVDNADKTAKVWKVAPGADYTVTLTATWKAAAQTKAVAPGYTYADGKLTLANAAGSNYDVWYTTDGTTASKTGTSTKYNAAGTGLVVDTATFKGIVKAKALQVATPTGAVYSDGDELVVTGYAYDGTVSTPVKSELTKFADQLNGLGAAQPSDSTATAPKYWDKVLKATTDAGTAAIKAVGYASAEDWAKVQAAQKKAVVDAAAAYEDAALDGKAAAVKAADGKTYTYATADQIAAAKAKVKVVTDAFAENTDGDSDYVDLNGKKTTKSTADAYIAADYVKAITAAANKIETETVPAADYDAAAAVTAELKAATTAEAAEGALAKYEALTSAQKKLVATADVAAAQEIVAAAELKDAQDDAAVSKTRNASKTVKAGKNGKTTKKQSVTLKAITSKSGAKVTYKKSSGSSKVSVKSGKAYLAKGVKKGTYKATVKATCGTQTAKIKVTFKVK